MKSLGAELGATLGGMRKAAIPAGIGAATGTWLRYGFIITFMHNLLAVSIVPLLGACFRPGEAGLNRRTCSLSLV